MMVSGGSGLQQGGECPFPSFFPFLPSFPLPSPSLLLSLVYLPLPSIEVGPLKSSYRGYVGLGAL